MWRKAAIGARSSPNRWVCRRLRDCSAFTSTCPASFQPTLTGRPFQGRPRHRVSQTMRRSLTNVCGSSIKRESPTGSRWGCGRRHYTESRTHPSAWRLISSNTTLSGARLYWEYWGKGYFNSKGVSIPVAVSVFPDELYPAPRSWTERAFPKLIYYKKADKAGHFAAWEQPQILVEDLRAGLRSLRSTQGASR